VSLVVYCPDFAGLRPTEIFFFSTRGHPRGRGNHLNWGGWGGAQKRGGHPPKTPVSESHSGLSPGGGGGGTPHPGGGGCHQPVQHSRVAGGGRGDNYIPQIIKVGGQKVVGTTINIQRVGGREGVGCGGGNWGAWGPTSGGHPPWVGGALWSGVWGRVCEGNSGLCGVPTRSSHWATLYLLGGCQIVGATNDKYNGVGGPFLAVFLSKLGGWGWGGHKEMGGGILI